MTWRHKEQGISNQVMDLIYIEYSVAYKGIVKSSKNMQKFIMT